MVSADGAAGLAAVLGFFETGFLVVMPLPSTPPPTDATKRARRQLL